MTWEAWFTLGIIGLVFIGLARNLGPPDVLLVGGVVILGLARILTPQEIFAGLTNEGMLTVAALFVVAAGLRETGFLDAVGTRLLGPARHEKSALLRIIPPVVGMSAFLNNTPIVAMLVPVVSDWCRKWQISPSRLLIPLSYLAILGGTCTLIGTSTNLVVSGMMTDHDLAPMSLFELSYVGLPYAVIGSIYLFFVGRRLLPDRQDMLERLGETRREYMIDMVVQDECRLIGQTVEAAGLRRLPGLFLIEITRNDQIISPVGPDQLIQAGDQLTFTGVISTIVDLERIPGLVPAADDSYESSSIQRRNRRLCEVVISRTSPLIGKNIREANFRALYNAAVIAVHRGGVRIKARIGDITLRAGDTLLIQAGPHFAQAHRNNPDFFLVSTVDSARPVRHDRMFISLVLLVGLILLMGTSQWTGLPIVLAAFLIAGLMVGTRCISASTARQSVDWQTLLTIAAALGLAQALEKTHAAETIAQAVASSIDALGPTVALVAVYLMTMIFTELITNVAAAALMFPLAIAIGQAIGVDPRPFAFVVAFAASASFVTPIGYQTNMMVYGPGGYRFVDFVRVGLPLSLILCVSAAFLIPWAWPF